MSADQPTVPYLHLDTTPRRRPPLGRLIWPWRIVTTELAQRAPLVALIRRRRQTLGIHFRLPDSTSGRHYGLAIRWGRPS